MNKSKFKKELGERIREIRKNLGFSQEEVAHRLNVPRPSVSQIERGERELSAEELAILSEFFGIPINELLETKPKIKKSLETRSESDIKVTFFRHGEATDDLYDQYGGWADPNLSPKGVNKAYSVAQELKRKGASYDIIFTSPLKRTRQVAEIIGRELQVDVKVLQYLKERNTYGLLCGLNKKVAQKKFPELVEAYESGKYVLGSEREEDFINRLPLIFSYLRGSNLKNICCITHGKIMTGIIKHLLKMKPEILNEGCMLEVGLDKETIYYLQSEGITFAK
jgi:broad specificity phosphatase PhoE/plasmid maintenance system antidote protein VapI